MRIPHLRAVDDLTNRLNSLVGIGGLRLRRLTMVCGLEATHETEGKTTYLLRYESWSIVRRTSLCTLENRSLPKHSAGACSIVRAIALNGLNARSDYSCQYKPSLKPAAE